MHTRVCGIICGLGPLVCLGTIHNGTTLPLLGCKWQPKPDKLNIQFHLYRRGDVKCPAVWWFTTTIKGLTLNS